MHRYVKEFCRTALLLITASLFLLPLLWMLVFSVAPPAASSLFPAPDSLTFSNYVALAAEIDLWQCYLNSLFISCATVLLQLLTSSLAGFALAQYEFRGKSLLLGFLLALLALPFELLLPGEYELLHRLKLLDTYAGLILPCGVTAFGVWMFYNAMAAVPKDLLDSARLDGCSEFAVWWRIALPAVRPTTTAFCVVGLIGNWNSYLWPAIVLHSESKYTLPLAINNLAGAYGQQFGQVMAAVTISSLPMFALMLFLHKEVREGMTSALHKQ